MHGARASAGTVLTLLAWNTLLHVNWFDWVRLFTSLAVMRLFDTSRINCTLPLQMVPRRHSENGISMARRPKRRIRRRKIAIKTKIKRNRLREPQRWPPRQHLQRALFGMRLAPRRCQSFCQLMARLLWMVSENQSQYKDCLSQVWGFPC